jgi:hypothetical protein
MRYEINLLRIGSSGGFRGHERRIFVNPLNKYKLLIEGNVKLYLWKVCFEDVKLSGSGHRPVVSVHGCVLNRQIYNYRKSAEYFSY